MFRAPRRAVKLPASETDNQMAQPFEMSSDARDPRAVRILAKNIYREFRANGFSERDVMALAGELLSLVTTEVKNQRSSEPGSDSNGADS
jgi:hypothetical protein